MIPATTDLIAKGAGHDEPKRECHYSQYAFKQNCTYQWKIRSVCTCEGEIPPEVHIGLNLSDNLDVTVLTDQDCMVIELASRILGFQAQFPINRLAEGIHQKDRLMDDLFTLLKGTPAYGSIREAVFPYPAIKSPLCTYVRGICSYIEGDYLTSAEYLFDAISIHPDNVDLWRYFAFALRHSGYYAACTPGTSNLRMI